MCGLFGSMSSTLVKNEINTTVQLGHLSVFRGIDSTGLLVVREEEKKGKTRMVFTTSKAPLPSPVFFFNETYASCLDKEEIMLVMGHTRAATIGELSTKNAHPHHFKHIIGCHNGTIRALNTREEDIKVGSDSRVLFKEIAEKGLSEALKRAAYGAYAISFVDTSNQTLNFIRNNDRTLYLGYNDAKSTVYWASERRFLEFVGVKSINIDLLPVNILHSFKIGSVKEVTKVEMDPRPTVVYRTGHSHWRSGDAASRWRERHYGDWTEEANDDCSLKEEPFCWPPQIAKEEETSEGEEAVRDQEALELARQIKEANDEARNILKNSHPFHHADKSPTTLDSSYQIAGGKVISLDEASTLLDQGCGFCSSPKSLEDDAYWANEIEWYCQDCYDRECIQQYFHAHQLSKGKIIRLHLA